MDPFRAFGQKPEEILSDHPVDGFPGSRLSPVSFMITETIRQWLNGRYFVNSTGSAAEGRTP
jgi:hypothetical protein